jgi:hypothetical protein
MSLSGSVFRSDTFAGVAGVTVTLTPGGATAVSDSGGVFVFVPDPGIGTYTATPTLAGFAFTPPSETFFYDGAATGLSFPGLPAPSLPPLDRTNRSGWRAVTTAVLTAPAGGVLALSNVRYATHPDDLPGNLSFLPWLNKLAAAAAITFWPWGGAGFASPLGEITAFNNDGSLDWVLTEDFRDARLEVRNGSERDPYALHQRIASARVDRVEADVTRLRIKLRSVIERFALPFTTRYVSADPRLDQRSRPVTLGGPIWVQPVLVDEVLQRYDVADGPYRDVVVYDDGVVAPHTATATGFQLFGPPVGSLVARVTGQTVAGDLTNTLQHLVRWLVARYPDPVEIDTDSLDDVSASASELAWHNSSTEVSGLALLVLALDTCGAAVCEGLDGRLRFVRLVDPWTVAWPPALAGQISGLSVELDRAPGLTTTVEILNNPGASAVPPGGYPGVDPALNNSLARETVRLTYSGAPLHPTYAREAGLRPARRVIAADPLAAQAELDRVCGLYVRRWWFFRFRVTLQDDTLEPGAVRLIWHPRFGLAGVPVMIVSVRASVLGSAVFDVTAWGTFTPP